MIGDRSFVRQLSRFGIVGISLTLATAAGYWLLATMAGVNPFLALTLSYTIATIAGYVAHDRFTFTGHGGRVPPGKRIVRFAAVTAVGYGLNQLFVWALVEQAGGPTWWPVVPIVLVTPIATFLLQRRLVFN